MGMSVGLFLSQRGVGGILCWSLRAPIGNYIASSRRVGGGPVTVFCHSKAWWKLFILAPPRVPDLASGRTPKALAAPSANPGVSR